MKNIKYVIILSIVIFVCALLIIKFKDSKSYAAPLVPVSEGAKYKYIRRNMLTHHYVSHNGSTESGTILLKTGDPEKTDGKAALAYCAHQGKNIAKTSSGKYYKPVIIDKTSVSSIKKQREKLKGVISNSYPYISLGELKERLRNSLGNDYNTYKFDNLDVQESLTATQAAIWNAIKGSKYYNYGKTKSIGSLYYKYFHKTGNKQWALNWDKTGTYNISTGCYNPGGSGNACGSKSTILQTGDTATSAGSYQKGDAVKNRINRLITWYYNQSGITGGSDVSPEYYVVEHHFNADGTIDVTIGDKGTNGFYTPSSIKFYDKNNNEMTPTSTTDVAITATKPGKKYEFAATDTDKVSIQVTFTLSSSNFKVYVYEANQSYSSTQYLIGGEKGGDYQDTDELEIVNANIGTLRVFKVGTESSESVRIVTEDVCGTTGKENCLDYATLGIYSDQACTQLVKSFITGTEYTDITLPTGTYYIKELSSPSLYSLNETVFEFTITNGEITRVQFDNKANKLCIKKVSSEDRNQVIDGARFSIQSASGGDILEEFVSSTQEGTYCLKTDDLEGGYYYITEIQTPPNYARDFTKYRVSVGNYKEELAEEIELAETDRVEDVTAVNDVVTIVNHPGVFLSKSDMTTGECVEGAKLIIKDKETDQEVISWTSTCTKTAEDGTTIGDDSYSVPVCDTDGGTGGSSSGTGSNENCLVKGKTYTLTEEMTEELRRQGYSSESETITFTVGPDGKVTESLNMKDAPINVCLYKVSKDSKTPLAGAKFNLYDENNKLFKSVTTSANKTDNCFTYVPYGTYTIKEIEAPNGYKALDDEIIIEIRDTKNQQEFYIENEVIAPKTAFNNNKITTIIALVFMSFGFAIFGYYIIHNKKIEE